MDLLTAIQSEPLANIQDIVSEKGLPSDSTWLDYDALNRALECERKDVAKWLIKVHCRVNKVSQDNSLRGNTPLHNAVKLGDIEIVEMLLKNRASIVAVDSDEHTALHLSFLYRYDKITDRLLEHVVENSDYANIKNKQGLSHLHIACTRNNVKAIEGFLGDKKSVNDIVKTDSPSCWAGYTALHFAIEFKSLEAAKVLLTAGSKMKGRKSSSGQSPLQVLHQYQDDYLIMSDHLDENAFSNFHLACYRESVSVVEKFIERGADLNRTIEQGRSLFDHYSPLQCAIESPYDRKEKVQLLVSHGATIERGYLHKQNHMTALHLAFYKEHMSKLNGTIVECLYKAVKDRGENIMDENELGYFHIAVTRNDFDTINEYLKNGAKINQAVLQNHRGFSGYTALHFAVHNRLVDMAKFLIEQGADVNADNSGRCHGPLFKAFEIGDISLIELLLESGARISTIGNPKTFVIESCNRLLHYAVHTGNHDMVQYLIKASNCKVDVRNNLGQTPLIVHLQTESPCKKIVEILLKAGANTLKEDTHGDYPLAIVSSGAWLIKSMERFEILKLFIEKEDNMMHFNELEVVDEKVVKMLVLFGVDLSTRDKDGTTLIHLLAKNGNPEVFKELRDQAFDVDARSGWGMTPLMLAALNGNANTVEILLDKGADIEAAETDSQRTALYFAHGRIIHERDEVERYKNVVQILLERGANAQVEIARPGQNPITILDLASRDDNSGEGKFELVLAHLAFQEANDTIINRLIKSKIDSCDGFKSYFEYCKQELSVEIYQTITLFNVLTASERKLESYFHNEELTAKLMAFQTIEYFNGILSKRLAKASAMVKLRKIAALVICKLLKTDYDRFPYIADKIVGYFDKQDLENLTSI